MQNKRFLGLGFTFAAQDKGLEKKLVRIASLFERINKSSGGLGNVGIGGSGRGGSVAGVYGRGGSGVRAAGGARSAASKMFGPSNKAKDNTQYLLKIGSQLTKALGKEVGPAFLQEASSLIDKGIKTGRTVNEVAEDMVGAATKMGGSADMVTKKFNSLSRIFNYISNWIGSIGKSVDNFLTTIGIDLRAMIPKEFTAAAGVLKSILSPLGHGAKAIGKKAIGSLGKSTADKSLVRVKAIGDSIGTSKSIPTIQKMLAEMLNIQEESKDQKGGGPLDKLKDFLSKIPFVGPVLAGLVGGIGKVVSALSTMGGWVWSAAKGLMSFGKTIFEFISDLSFGDILGGLAKSFEFLWNGARALVEGFTELIVPVVALAGAAWGFAQELGNIAKSIGNFFASTFNLVTAAVGYFTTWLQTSTGPLAAVINGVAEGFKFLGVILKAIFQIFEVFGKNIGKLIGSVFDLGSIFADNATRELQQGTQQMQKDAVKQSPSAALKEAVASGPEAANSEKSLSLSEKTNDLLSQMLDKLDTSRSSTTVDINLKTKPREFEATVQRNEKLNAASQGTAGANL